MIPLRRNIDTLVDFGSGCGKSTRAVANCVNEGGKIIGVDISADMIREAEDLTQKRKTDHPNVSFEYRQITNQDEREVIPLPDGSVDAVTTTIVLEEMQTEKQLRNAISEIGRITKQGGYFAAVCVSDKITTEDFTAFTYAPFEDNKTREDNIRRCESVVSRIVWDKDRHWSQEQLTKATEDAGFQIREIEYPLASKDSHPFPDDPSKPWRDEVHTSPFVVIVAQKGAAESTNLESNITSHT